MKYVHGDITTVKSGLIIHGVNCKKAMGSGVAKSIKDKWPLVYDEYMSIRQGKEVLGKVQFVNISLYPHLTIANCFTQEFFGNEPGRVYADIEAVRSCLRKAFMYASLYEVPLYSPKIASLRAGLDWDKEVVPVFEEMEALFPEVKVTIYYVDANFVNF